MPTINDPELGALEPVTDEVELATLNSPEPVQQTISDPELGDLELVTDDSELAVLDERSAFGAVKDEVVGGVQAIGSVASSIPAEIAGGLAGFVVAPKATPEQTSEVIERTSERLTYNPSSPEGRRNIQALAKVLKPVGDILERAEKASGDAGFDLAGPIGGAIASALPASALELLGLAGLRATKSIAKSAESAPADTPKPEIQSIADDLRSDNLESVAESVNPDPEILAAAEELQVDINPSAASQNQAFIETEQSLKSRPGSQIATKEQQSIKDIGARAEALVEGLGGSSDRSLIDSKVRGEFTAVTDDMSSQSNALYKDVENAVSPSSRINVDSVRQYLEEKLSDLGGDESLLTKSEKTLKALVDNDQLPTYAALDRVRRNVGEGFRRRGVFADDESGTLEQVYAALSRDQLSAAEGFGVGGKLKQAQKLVADRKGLESQMIQIYGKNLEGSLISKITTSANALTKGDAAQIRKLMQSVPENLRRDVATSVLDDIFTAGTRNKASLGQGFVKAYEGLNRSPTAKTELFRHLPEEAARRFDLIGKVATGIFKSKALENTSKTARDVIAAMDDGGMFGKVYQTGRKIAAAEAVSSSVGFPGAGAAGVIGATLARSKKSANAAADELLSSGKFSRAVKTAALGKQKQSDNIIKKSAEYKRWARTASPEDLAEINKLGFVAWLTAGSQIPRAGSESDQE